MAEQDKDRYDKVNFHAWNDNHQTIYYPFLPINRKHKKCSLFFFQEMFNYRKGQEGSENEGD